MADLQHISQSSSLAEIQRICERNACETRESGEKGDALERRRRQFAADRAREQSLLYGSFTDASPERFRVQSGTRTGQQAVQAVIASGFATPLALYGLDTGVGKTYLAHAIANAAVAHGLVARIVNAVDLVIAVNDARRKLDIGELDVIANFADTPVLVLDDLGKELLGTKTMVDAAVRTLFLVVDRRINRPPGSRALTLIATSNYSFPRLIELYAAKFSKTQFQDSSNDEPGDEVYLVDRLRALIPLDHWVEMRGKSLRGRNV